MITTKDDSASETDSQFILGWAKRIKAINMLGGKCVDCGNSDVLCLTFHHKDKKDKECEMASLKFKRWSLMESEAKKCEVLCSNCHRERHCNGYGRHNDDKQKLLVIKDLFRCEKCGYVGKNYSSLDFHHLRDKKFMINDRRLAFVTVELLAEEISKCSVLCANCHKVEHTMVDRFNKFKEAIYDKSVNYVELSPKKDREQIWNMFYYQKMKQQDIATVLKCAKSTISEIVNSLIVEKGAQVNGKSIVVDSEGNSKVLRVNKKFDKVCEYCEIGFVTHRPKKVFCSRKCRQMGSRNVNRPSLEELIEMKKTMNCSQIARKLGVSDVAVGKWLKIYL